MLDPALTEQLRSVFAELSTDYAFVVHPSAHEKQAELLDLLRGLASASPRLRVVEQGPPTEGVQFELVRGGAPTGVRFRGVPGGHEFTSLVLAVLHADGKGKRPDDAVLARVRRLRGPIELRTYVSLACTSCPDVVQALGLMALVHGDFRHTMIDGALAEDEVRALGVQAVPAVFDGGQLLHVGKATFSELLEVLEERFGVRAPAVAATSDAPAGSLAGEAGGAPAAPKPYDVVVIGGGPAGAAAAIYSARKGLKTAIVAARLGGQLQETVGIENLVGTKRTEGKRLSADLEEHVRAYAIDVLEHRKVERIEAGEAGASKRVILQGGESLAAPAIILATGARWRELGIPGEREYLGRGVAFCPHCDGPFYKGKRVAVVGGGNSGVEAAIDLAGICAHVTLVEFLDELKADAVLVKHLRALPNVDVVTGARTTEIVGGSPDGDAGGGVRALRYQDRKSEETREIELAGVFVQIGLVPNSAFVRELLETNRAGEIVVDARNRTSVAGIYAAGDVTTAPFKQIVIAMGEGAKAALTAFEDRLRA